MTDDSLCRWEIPGGDVGSPLVLDADPGELTVVVGANGSGKSALGLWMELNADKPVVKRLIAHRRLWLQSAGPDITSSQRTNTVQNISTWSRQTQSRWLDNAQNDRANVVLFDLMASVNDRNARVADLVAQSVPTNEIQATVGPSLLERLNDILRDSQLDVQVVLGASDTLDAVNSRTGARYPITQMSDGEKSALLLAAEVLTASSGLAQVIDEPERHLHRLISAELVAAVVAARPDCHFVVLTHDLELASALGGHGASLFVLSGCSWEGDTPAGWQIHAVDEHGVLAENVRRAILGGRTKVLFLEGQSGSLDLRLYRRLFPEWALVPSGGCEDVIRAVSGLSASDPHHWLRASGIVDGDGRDDAEREALRRRGVLVLPVSEVESLYYCDAALAALAQQQADALDKSAAALLDIAVHRGLAALQVSGTPERLAGGVAEKIVRRSLLSETPDPESIIGGVDPVEVRIPSPYPGLLAELNALIGAENLTGVIRGFPIRDSGACPQIASALGFKSRDDYEAAVGVRVESDPALAAAIREQVGELA